MSNFTDEQIEEIQGKAYRDLVAKGYTGGMGSLQWDRASARAIEAATAAKLNERIADLQAKLDAAAVDAERWTALKQAVKSSLVEVSVSRRHNEHLLDVLKSGDLDAAMDRMKDRL